MNSSLEDQLVVAHRELVKILVKAAKTRDPKAVKKIKQAEKLLEKAEDEANKTMDPKLKKKCDELLKKFQIICDKVGY